ncbi:B3 domain-containing transcription factor VRN1 [Trifolium repens]|nr:B3 domain-containing transcription factor VRN1 [Trifolium repens]
MARTNATLSIRFFKIILQTNLQKLKIPNKFTKSHGVGLSNPVLINPPDGTKWKVYWKNINGEIWFEKGWNDFSQNYSLGHGCLVLFKYKEGTSNFNVLILAKNAVEIDYGPSCHTYDDENNNIDHSNDESVEILDEKDNVDHSNDESVMILDELSSPRPHKKVRGETENTTTRISLNWPKEAKAQKVTSKFNSCNPFFTILIKPYHLVKGQLFVPSLKGVFENKDKNVKLQIEKISWNVKLLPCHGKNNGRHLSAGWSLFASESGLQPGNVCVFELINKKDLIFKVHVF